MKNEMHVPLTSPAEGETPIPGSFRCPGCMLADTCSDCNMYRSSTGECLQFGGFCDPDRWACSWYYTH